MNRQKVILLLVSLALIGGTALLLLRLKTHQRLGEPGVRTTVIPGSLRRTIELPQQVLDYDSKYVEADEVATNTLPKDTSFGQRLYTAPDGFQISMNVVLMGTDRTSLHKPQFCLRGAGWQIDTTEDAAVAIPRPHPYELPAVRITASRQAMVEGKPVPVRGVYVYWYVADQSISADASGLNRMRSTVQTLLTTGVLQRWAYVTCFAVCMPGQEAATFERMKKFMAAAVPDFQLAAGSARVGARPAGL